MTVKSILRMGDRRLLQQAAPVTEFDTPELHQLAQEMFSIMRSHAGVGLAAPQIGISLQIVVFGLQHSERYPQAQAIPDTVLINPQIQILDTELESGWEGCLSIPGMRGLVPRSQHIRYSGFDCYGHAIERTASGFHARVVQHECDHLSGLLYPMRIDNLAHFGFSEELFPSLSNPN